MLVANIFCLNNETISVGLAKLVFLFPLISFFVSLELILQCQLMLLSFYCQYIEPSRDSNNMSSIDAVLLVITKIRKMCR